MRMRAEFLLDSDPGAWRFAQAGEIHDGTVTISYGPQLPIASGVRFSMCGGAAGRARWGLRPRIPVRRPTEMPSRSPPFQAHRETIGTPSRASTESRRTAWLRSGTVTNDAQQLPATFHVEG